MNEQVANVVTDLEENDDFYLSVYGMTQAEYFFTLQSGSQLFPTEEELELCHEEVEEPTTKSAVERVYGEEFALVLNETKPVCYGFYNTYAEAANNKTRFGKNCEVMTFKEFQAKECFFYLSQPLEKITQKEYEDKFCMLAPLEYHADGENESFIFAELVHGSFAEQYIKFSNNSFWRKLVDRCNNSTWIDSRMMPTHAQIQAGAILASLRNVG